MCVILQLFRSVFMKMKGGGRELWMWENIFLICVCFRLWTKAVIVILLWTAVVFIMIFGWSTGKFTSIFLRFREWIPDNTNRQSCMKYQPSFIIKWEIPTEYCNGFEGESRKYFRLLDGGGINRRLYYDIRWVGV